MDTGKQNPFAFWWDMNNKMVETMKKNMGLGAQEKQEAAPSNPMQMFQDMWMQSMKQTPFANMANMTNMAQGWDKNPWLGSNQAMFNPAMWSNPASTMQQMNKQMQDNMKMLAQFIPSQPVKDSFNRFMDSYSAFNGLQSFWDLFLKNMPTQLDTSSWNDYTANAMKGYQEMATSFGQAFMPAELKSLMTLPMDNASTFQNLSSEFFKPWVENSPAMQEKLILAMQGDRKAYLEFTKIWTENYKATYSKMLNMPTLGSNRVTIEKMLKMLDQYNDFLSNLNEYNVLISDSMDETMKKLFADLSLLQKEGKQPQTFMEFFKLWSKVNETALQDLFVTELFAKVMNDTIATGSRFKLAFDDLIQETFSFLPFPNRKEINAVEEEVYKLRNRIKKLEKEIEALKEPTDKKTASKTK